MSHPINLLTAMVRKGDSINLTFRAVDAGTQVVFQPALHGVSEAETDPQLAQQIAALALPFVFTVPPGGDVSAALAEALNQVFESRKALVSANASYVAALDDAAARARQATAEKAKAKATTTKADAKPAKAAAGTGADDAADAEDTTANEGTPAAETAASDAPASATPEKASVFD
ncbi:MAG: hypothetical protein ABS98_01885 [Lysobacteraceae bacterium SCN 69-48]|nr:MAG: hypothetical protein ABS98_01885 [Xanthomonadaceae bacterium SCN 69-48]